MLKFDFSVSKINLFVHFSGCMKTFVMACSTAAESDIGVVGFLPWTNLPLCCQCQYQNALFGFSFMIIMKQQNY